MRKSVLGCLLALVLSAISPLRATVITYTITGTASGTVGSTNFANQPFIFTLTSNTTIRRTVATATYAEAALTNNFSLSGVGTGSFTDALDIFDNQTSQIAGVTDSTSTTDLFDLGNSAFGTYGMLTSLGPLSTTSSRLVSNEPTTLGTLSFSSFTTATFAAAVPEPSTWTLLGLGGAGLLGLTLRCRRPRAAAGAVGRRTA